MEPRTFELVYHPDHVKRLRTFVDLPAKCYSPREVVADPSILRDVELIFSSWGAPILDAHLLDAAPKLRAFFYGAGSIKSIVTPEFWQRRIVIATAAAANAVPVAEMSLAQIILSLKRSWWYMQEVRAQGKYPERDTGPGVTAGGYGSTIGLVSLGMIGRLVREKLRVLEDVKVIAYDPFLTHEDAAELGVESVSLAELFRRSDVVSLHTPWLKETEGLITGEHFASMKPNATFINTSRGMVVDEEAMLQVLQKRTDLYAVLDVVRQEPPPPGSPLYTLPNVVLTPHIAGSMHHECWRMGHLMIEEAQRFLEGQPLRCEITEAQAAITA